MAQRILTHYVDDLDGSEADGPVKFGLDGKTYEIDLSEGNVAALRDLLAPYVAAARKLTGKAATSPTKRKHACRDSETMVIREWAKAQGLDVKERGRIPEEIVIRYNGRAA